MASWEHCFWELRAVVGFIIFIFKFSWLCHTARFMLWSPGHEACGCLDPPPGIEPVPLALEVRSLNHWTAREVPGQLYSCSQLFPVYSAEGSAHLDVSCVPVGGIYWYFFLSLALDWSPSWANGSESDAHHVYVKASKAKVGFFVLPLCPWPWEWSQGWLLQPGSWNKMAYGRQPQLSHIWWVIRARGKASSL